MAKDNFARFRSILNDLTTASGKNILTLPQETELDDVATSIRALGAGIRVDRHGCILHVFAEPLLPSESTYGVAEAMQSPNRENA